MLTDIKKKLILLTTICLAAAGVFTACGKGDNRDMENTQKEDIMQEEKDAKTKAITATVPFKEDIKELTYTNDLGVKDIGDPFMLRVSENEYYMYCTSAPNGFYAWKSSDMINWNEKKMCYVKKLESWNTDCFWAPEVIAYEGKYYMFYTAKNTEGSLRIGLAIADDPMGPFTDFENRPLFDLGYAAIDSNVFIDEDGSKYLYFSKDCSENIIDGQHISQIYGVKLSDNLMSIEGEPVLLTTPSQAWEKPQGGWGWNEGPEMIKHNGKYYLTYSANYYESPYYSLGVAISDSPLGEFVKPDYNPILTKGDLKDVSGTGHHGFVESPDKSEIWMSYHSHTFVDAPSGNRKVNIAKVDFLSDGRIYVNGPTTDTQLRPSGNGVDLVTGKFSAAVLRDGKYEVSALLTDGLFSVHKKDSFLDEIVPIGDDGVGIIRLTAAEPVDISALCINFGYEKAPSDLSLRFCFDEKEYTESTDFKDVTGSSFVYGFEGVSSKTIDIIFTSDTLSNIHVSEIQTAK